MIFFLHGNKLHNFSNLHFIMVPIIVMQTMYTVSIVFYRNRPVQCQVLPTMAYTVIRHNTKGFLQYIMDCSQYSILVDRCTPHFQYWTHKFLQDLLIDIRSEVLVSIKLLTKSYTGVQYRSLYLSVLQSLQLLKVIYLSNWQFAFEKIGCYNTIASSSNNALRSITVQY